jgi:protein SCO1/2
MNRLAPLPLLLALMAALLAGGPANAFDPFKTAGVDRRPDARVPMDLPFTLETGAQATLRQLSDGKPILLAPVLHRCPNICGMTLSGLASAVQAQKFQPGRDFVLVAFGIDPREGPADSAYSLGELRRSFPSLGTAGLHAVTGAAADIPRVTDGLGYRFAWDDRIGQYAHISAVAVLTPEGRLARWLYGIVPDPIDVRLALTEAGEGRTGDWADQLLLLCYHYDPEAGQYGSLVWILLRVGGTLTLATGGTLIGLAILRERRRLHRGVP